jgi:glycosyltransferase involved in cell wall biosynthesis
VFGGAVADGLRDGFRVGLVLGTSTGGIGRHVRSLAAGLAAAGVRVRVLGPADTERRFDFTATGAEFLPVEISAGLDPVRDTAALVALRSGLRGVDLVHAHGMRAGLLSAGARRLPGGGPVPLVVTWHNVVLSGGVKGKLLRQLERVVARSADLTLCASGDMIGRVLRLGGRDVRLGAVAAPVLPPATRTPAEVRAELGAGDRPLVLSVGRLHPQKSYDVLVAAAARWRDLDPEPLVVIAGSGPSQDALAAQVAATGAPVTLLGHRTDVPDLLAAADLAVITSRWEARQLFAQEALRAGVPLVTTAVGGLPGLVGDAAVLVPVPAGSGGPAGGARAGGAPAGDGAPAAGPAGPAEADPRLVDAIDKAVRTLLADEGRRAELAGRGPRQAATWPTEDDTLAQVLAVYAELVG